MFDDVFHEMPRHLLEQRAQVSAAHEDHDAGAGTDVDPGEKVGDAGDDDDRGDP